MSVVVVVAASDEVSPGTSGSLLGCTGSTPGCGIGDVTPPTAGRAGPLTVLDEKSSSVSISGSE